MPKLKLGFSAPTRGDMANAADLKTIVQRGEALGFDYFSVSDHIVIPKDFAPAYPYADDGKPTFPSAWLEQLTAMAWLAGLTERLRMLTSVMVVPHRKPVHTAKILATIDVLSGGRLTVGCGAGWMAEEFAAVGTEPFAERGKVTDEYLRVFRELWTSEAPRFDGDYTQFDNIVFDPQPVQQPGIPIWVGGESERGFAPGGRIGRRLDAHRRQPKIPLAYP